MPIKSNKTLWIHIGDSTIFLCRYRKEISLLHKIFSNIWSKIDKRLIIPCTFFLYKAITWALHVDKHQFKLPDYNFWLNYQRKCQDTTVSIYHQCNQVLGAFFVFRCLISNPTPTSSLHIGSMKDEFITLTGKNSLYLPPQSGNSGFKSYPIVQKWLFMASDILLISLMTFQSVNTLFIEVDIDPALGFIIGFRIFTYCTQKFH